VALTRGVAGANLKIRTREKNQNEERERETAPVARPVFLFIHLASYASSDAPVLLGPWVFEYKIQNTKIQNTEYRIQVTK
jgi:hypothetical protein